MFHRALLNLFKNHFSSLQPKISHSELIQNYKRYSSHIQKQHQFHHRTFKFFRQVLSCAMNPALVNNPSLNPEARLRGKAILDEIVSVGAYSQSKGIRFIRNSICKFIAKMDDVPEPCKQEVSLTQGASRSLDLVLKTMIIDSRDAVMIPSPNYPLHAEIIKMYGGTVGKYLLDESKGWDIDLLELERVYANLEKDHKKPKAIIITNPGNPTGTTLSYQTIANVLQFSVKHRLLVIADEVCRQNIPDINSTFQSCRKVLERLPQTIRDNCELFSIYSISKGLTMTPGLRGGYFYAHNISPFTKAQLYKYQTIFACSNLMGQLMVDLTTNPFQGMSQPTKSAFLEEYFDIKRSIIGRGKTIAEALNKMQGMSCQYTEGSIYLYPSIKLSQKAIAAAQDMGISVDQFYCQRMQQNTGTALLPGSIFGQSRTIHHFRITPSLFLRKQLPFFLQTLKNSNLAFQRKYAD